MSQAISFSSSPPMCLMGIGENDTDEWESYKETFCRKDRFRDLRSEHSNKRVPTVQALRRKDKGSAW